MHSYKILEKKGIEHSRKTAEKKITAESRICVKNATSSNVYNLKTSFTNEMLDVLIVD